MIITLCGSARFERAFHLWNCWLTFAENTVFTLTTFSSAQGGKEWYTTEQKLALDAAHKRKIDASDVALIITREEPGVSHPRYVDESTASEISHAKARCVRVIYDDEALTADRQLVGDLVSRPRDPETEWIETRTGRFYPLDPREEDVSLEAIAWALANTQRFGGHSSRAYSVAQHSVAVALEVPPDYALDALFHDASESALTDVARPIKPHLHGYAAAERRVQGAIARRFGLGDYEADAIKVVDRRMLVTEASRWSFGAAGKWWLSGEHADYPAYSTLPTMLSVWPPWLAYNRFVRLAQHLLSGGSRDRDALREVISYVG